MMLIGASISINETQLMEQRIFSFGSKNNSQKKDMPSPSLILYFDQLFVCCVVVYSDQPLVGSLYTGITYHDNTIINC